MARCARGSGRRRPSGASGAAAGATRAAATGRSTAPRWPGRVDQLVGEVARVEVEQADPVDPLGHRPTSGHEVAAAAALVAAVGGQVLGHQHDLAGAELVDLGQQVVERAAALLAPEPRDGAEAAGPVAALGHLQVGPRRRRRRAGQVEQVEGRHRRPPAWPRSRRPPRPWRPTGIDGGPTPTAASDAEAGHEVDLGQGLGQLVAVALGQAAGDHDLGPGARPWLRARTVSIDSWRASSMNAQVLTTTRSAWSAPSAAVRPSASSVPASLSESTWFFGQPSVSTQKVRAIDADRTGARRWPPPSGTATAWSVAVAAPKGGHVSSSPAWWVGCASAGEVARRRPLGRRRSRGGAAAPAAACRWWRPRPGSRRGARTGSADDRRDGRRG